MCCKQFRGGCGDSSECALNILRGGCGDSSECAVNNLGEGVETVVNVL